MWSQVGLRKHHYKESWWRWWNSSWVISNPKRWCCENAALNMPANLENSAMATGLENVNFHSNPKGSAKECSNYCTIALISHGSKVILKILQARLQQYVNCELPDVQAGFRKGRGTRDQISNTQWIIRTERVPEKHLLLLYWLRQSLWLCGSLQTGKFFQKWEYQTTWLASWEICIQVKKQQNWTWNNRLVPNQERSTSRLYMSPCLFNLHAEYIMRNAGLEEAQAGIKIAGRNINNLIRRWRHPYGRKQRRTNEPLYESERGEWKSWLKTKNSENLDHGIQSHHFMANRWGNNGNSDGLYFGRVQNRCRWWL